MRITPTFEKAAGQTAKANRSKHKTAHKKEKPIKSEPTHLSRSEVRAKIAKIENEKVEKSKVFGNPLQSAEETKGKLKDLLNSNFAFSDKEREVMSKMLKQ